MPPASSISDESGDARVFTQALAELLCGRHPAMAFSFHGFATADANNLKSVAVPG